MVSSVGHLAVLSTSMVLVISYSVGTFYRLRESEKQGGAVGGRKKRVTRWDSLVHVRLLYGTLLHFRSAMGASGCRIMLWLNDRAHMPVGLSIQVG